MLSITLHNDKTLSVNIYSMTKEVKRLYKNFRPHKYVLDIIVDKDSMKFSGTVIIVGNNTGRPSCRLTFHQNGIKITKAHVTKHDKLGDHEIIIDRINHHRNFDEVRLHASKILYGGQYTVRMEFSGKITRHMNGIYPCFFEKDGHEKKLIATQFESHHAREVFPCIDEPEAKAVFELSLTSPAGEIVLSNTPISSQKTVGTNFVTKFHPTPHMSTYLLAFVIGELSYKQAKTKDGVIVRTYATNDNLDLTDFALEIAVKCLDFYNDYFGIDYPLEKCDLIALPDFASGAMENWGCITFREHAMLVDPKNSTLATKQYVALVVAHELTHQWFGNLVTMRWWTDLWLNEGFASWMEYLAIDFIYPDWELWTQFAVDEQQQAMKLDALEHTHPVEVQVKHPDEIRSIFDAISYSKGASVIHMLHDYLGPKVFRDGLRHYLQTYKYKNTDTIDLWNSLEEISGKPVKDFMHAWTSQPGFPILKVDVDEKIIKIEQSRFYANPLNKKFNASLWPVPLLTNKEDDNSLTEVSTNLDIKNNQELKLNHGQSGFYRVTYNATHIQRLGELIKKGHLNPLDRLGILTDQFETAKAGKSNTSEALNFLQNFVHENNYAVWDTIASIIGNIKLVMGDDELRDDMKPFIRNLVTPELNRLGWERKSSDSHFDLLLRPIILGLAASADDPTVVERCKELFESIESVNELASDLRATASSSKIKRSMDIDPDLRGTVFGTVARLGGAKEFDKLLNLHNESTLSEERTSIAAALTGFRQINIAKRALNLIDSKTVRMQDVSYWIAYSFMNRFARNSTWDWLQSKWDWLDENLGSDLAFYRMPIYTARVFSDKEFIPKYRKFYSSKLSPALLRSYNQGLEILEINTEWKLRDAKEVRAFFKQK